MANKIIISVLRSLTRLINNASDIQDGSKKIINEPLGVYVYEVQAPDHYYFSGYLIPEADPAFFITNMTTSLLQESLEEERQADGTYKGYSTGFTMKMYLSCSRVEMPDTFNNELNTLLKNNGIE